MEASNVTKKEQLLQEIGQAPDPFLDEVIDFIHFLKMKAIQEKTGGVTISESSLKKDWLKPEEEEAWRNL